MPYSIDLTTVIQKNIYSLGDVFSGSNPQNTKIGFSNYYMTVNEKPYFGITGEMHFSRIREDEWEDSIIKAKMDGLNILSTYVFWNVHEEVRGQFRFDGCRDIRKFVLLCEKHGMKVIVRIGPFAHGEMRNGGMPDWLYGMPFEVRNNSEGYLYYVRRLFRKINEQLEGLYFRQGGPVVGTQIENEYMHSSAGWEITTGTSKELLNGGQDQEEHMLELKKIAMEEGIITPFYTCTAWGGAMTPTEEMIPLWGGYSYQPWLFHDKPGVHPMTPEYIYRDNHNNAVTKTYNFEPRFEPESRPYACCEMMGGMFNSYQYRFVLPFESIDALANIKLGSGCNLLGYYMYRGGTTPTGERTPFLNEYYTPKRSYDFQAAIGENGQTRPSYFRLRPLHLFCTEFADALCRTKTVIPDYMDDLQPDDFSKLRYSIRIFDNSGFVFLNNFQDHAKMPDINAESIKLQLAGEDVKIEDICLASGENAILPFNLHMQGALLKYATAQLITTVVTQEMTNWFFFTPEGMNGRYVFSADSVKSISGCSSKIEGNQLICVPDKETNSFMVTTETETFRIFTLTREDSLRFSKVEIRGKEYVFLNDGTLLWDGEKLKVEVREEKLVIMAYPSDILQNMSNGFSHEWKKVSCDLFAGYVIEREVECTKLLAKKVGPSRFVTDIPVEQFKNHKMVELHVDYTGDIGHLFIAGELIADNFFNGTTWVSRIDDQADMLKKDPLTIYITPIRENAKLKVNAMAARLETADGIYASLEQLKLVPVDDIQIPL